LIREKDGGKGKAKGRDDSTNFYKKMYDVCVKTTKVNNLTRTTE
jgi:hypothetical protein